jgi:hypothetical protein
MVYRKANIPPDMYSPNPSPTLRAITHIYPRTSYFTAPPSPPQTYTTHTYIHSPRTVQPLPYSSPQPSSPLVGCLKPPRRESEQHQAIMTRPEIARRQSFHLDNRPLLVHQHQLHPISVVSGPRPVPVRRNTLRQSAIPLLPTPPPIIEGSSENQRRRPSFKIDLPPRTLPNVEGGVKVNKPGPAGTPYYEHPAQLAFREPFLNDVKKEGEYVILQPEVQRGGWDYDGVGAPSPTQCHGETLVGLGYSLNRMRAPTPWIREEGRREGEWLSDGDVDELEVSLRGMGVA